MKWFHWFRRKPRAAATTAVDFLPNSIILLKCAVDLPTREIIRMMDTIRQAMTTLGPQVIVLDKSIEMRIINRPWLEAESVQNLEQSPPPSRVAKWEGETPKPQQRIIQTVCNLIHSRTNDHPIQSAIFKWGQDIPVFPSSWLRGKL